MPDSIALEIIGPSYESTIILVNVKLHAKDI